MTTTFTLDMGTLRNFVGPQTDSGLLQNLWKVQIKKRLLELASLQRQLEREAPELAEMTGFSSAYRFLRQLPPNHLTRIISYPSFGQWCAVASSLLARQAHINLPDGQISFHLGMLGSFALVGALQSRLMFETTLKLDDRAYLPLPTLQRVIVAPLELAGAKVHCRVAPDEQLTISNKSVGRQSFHMASPAEVQMEGEQLFILRQAPLLANRFELNDYDLFLEHNTEYQRVQRFDQVSEASAQRWRQSVESAWELLDTVHPAYASQVGQYVSVIVPLLSAASDVHVSASFPETYGMVQMSWIENEVVLAEALVHEYHHNKLNTLFALDPLIIDESGAALYYSPWRDDMRPLRGLLHGIFAFQAVTHFWRMYLDHTPVLPLYERAELEYSRRRAQTLAALEALLTQATLTEAGGCIVMEIQRQLLAQPESALPRIQQQKIHDDLATHQLNWYVTHRPVTPRRLALLDDLWYSADGRSFEEDVREDLSIYAASSTTLQAVYEQLGVPHGITVNRIANMQGRRDPTLDTLSLESVRNPERYRQLAKWIMSDETTPTPLQQLLKGHVAYIQGAYATSAHYYSYCVQTTPDNLDVWRDFAFALRHLGLQQEANAFLFQPHLVVTVAQRYVIERHVLERLLPDKTDVPSDFAAIDLISSYILLLRWLHEGALEEKHS